MIKVGKFLLVAAHPSFHGHIGIVQPALVCLGDLCLREIVTFSGLFLHILQLLRFNTLLRELELIEKLSSVDLSALVLVHDREELLDAL